MESMTLAKGLAELKLLDKRIAKKRKTFSPCAVRRGHELRGSEARSQSEFERKSLGAWQSLHALVDRRRKIEASIKRANTSAFVRIAGADYTIAEALDLKKMITFEQEIITDLRRRLAQATAAVDRISNSNNDKLMKFLKEVHQKGESQLLDVDHQVLSHRFREVHHVELVDPIDLEKTLEEFEGGVAPFLKEVDERIAEANRAHYITVLPS